MFDEDTVDRRNFPLSAGVLMGLGIGGFFDGIVLHQLLQWHHMLSSAGYPPDTLGNLQINTRWDGLFHTLTYLFLALGLAIFWRHARSSHRRWSTQLLVGSLLVGWGAFNVVEGVVNHHILGLHHVNETVARPQWIAWDLAFLVWGAVMLIVGVYLVRIGQRRTGERRRAEDRASASPSAASRME